MSNLHLCIVRIYYSVLSILVWTLNDFVLTQLFFFAIYRKPVSLIKYAFRLQFMFPIWSICFDFWMILCFTFYISLHFFFFFYFRLYVYLLHFSGFINFFLLIFFVQFSFSVFIYVFFFHLFKTPASLPFLLTFIYFVTAVILFSFFFI